MGSIECFEVKAAETEEGTVVVREESLIEKGPDQVAREKREAEERASYNTQDLKVPKDFDCKGCGACCAPLRNTEEGYVELLHSDIIGLGLQPESRDKNLVIKKVGRAPNSSGYHLRLIKNKGKWQRYEEKRCGLLVDTVGEAAECGVYAQRPWACKVFEVGSWACTELRHDHYKAGNPNIKPNKRAREV